MASLTVSGFRRLIRRSQLLVISAMLLACQAKPAGREAYSGDPVRPAIDGCTALVDEARQPCVRIDVFAEGEGDPVVRGEWAHVHYIVDVDGNQLDSSHDGKPLSFRVGESSD